MEREARIFVAGAGTLIGAALTRELHRQGYSNLVNDVSDELALDDGAAVDQFFARMAPEYIFLVGGKSGGIRANEKYPADLIRDNLLVQSHVIHSACQHGAKKLLYLASSCSYPRQCPQPMGVESLLTGPLEPTSEAYAVAKIAGIKLCQAYRQQYGLNAIVGIPADAFGVGDDFDAEDSHVIPALIRRMHEGKMLGTESVELWGTGAPRREFLFADDLADACVFLMRKYNDDKPINIGGGTELSIGELAEQVKDIVGYCGRLRFDPSKPDGMLLKVLDSSVLGRMGWRPRTPFRSALSRTYEWFLRRREVTVAALEDSL